ncbi:hypothetical protein C8R47DRAFT_1196825 [Mycena vitilis]|nr:hypothetical protein C8R47DRAFT_1196825 [Mycena vitilis]
MFEDPYEDDYVPDIDEDGYEEYVQTQERYHNESRLAGSTSRSDEEEEEEEDHESMCNGGKGIQYLIIFQPQLLPLKPNEPKRRSNARAEKIKTHVYLHEKRALGDVLDAVIKVIGRDGPNDHSMRFKVVGHQLRTTRFKVNWTISRTDYKNMQLSSVKDFEELVKQVMEKAKAVVTLEVKEEPLEVAASASDAGEGASNGDGSQDRPAKKRKVDDIYDRIAELKLEGPHVLEYVENAILDRYLTIGQRASLRFAEGEWKKGKVGL